LTLLLLLLLNHNQLGQRRGENPSKALVGASPGKQVMLVALLVPGYLPVLMVLLVHNFCRGMYDSSADIRSQDETHQQV
jgi:hypothetical protein